MVTVPSAEHLYQAQTEFFQLGIVDRVLGEPSGGNHWAPLQAAETLRTALCEELNQLTALSRQELMDQRYGKYRRIGRYLEHPEMDAAATSDTLESSAGA